MVTIDAAVNSVLQIGCGFRNFSRLLPYVFQCIKAPLQRVPDWFDSWMKQIPSYNTTKNWVLKIGSFKLGREKRRSAHWAFLIDKTIQMGPDKCLVIAGVLLDDLDPENLTLSHQNLEPIVLEIGPSIPGESVYECLKRASSRTGVPCEIVSDGGSDLAKGIRLFVAENQATTHHHDITHKLALLMKAEFSQDLTWEGLKKQALDLTQKIKLSAIGHLAPTRLRPKSSILNLGQFICWACGLFNLIENNPEGSPEAQLVEEHCGWIRGYRDFLQSASQIVALADEVKRLIHRMGYREESLSLYRSLLATSRLTSRAKRCAGELEIFLTSECAKVPKGAFRIGSTDVLESVFGKFKHIERQYSSEGFTTLAGALPALMGPTTPDVTKAALSQYTVQQAKNLWGGQGTAETYMTKRRRDLGMRTLENLNLEIYPFQDDFSLCKTS